MHDYTDAQGWSLTYPSALHVVQGFPPTAVARQVTLTSFAAPRKLAGRSPTGKLLRVSSLPYVLPLDAAGRFPADGAALVLQPFRGFALGPDSAFPLVLDQFGRPQAEPFFSSVDDRSAAIPPGRTHIVVGYSQEIIVTVLIGAKASGALRSDLASTIASLSFRRLAPGSLVGGAEILGPASAYPVGSFTLFDARFAPNSNEPIYLVHAPGRLGFGHQCLSNSPCTPAGPSTGSDRQYNTRLDHAPVCQLRLDRPLDEFYCANMGVRWDRVGRVISPPRQRVLHRVDRGPLRQDRLGRSDHDHPRLGSPTQPTRGAPAVAQMAPAERAAVALATTSLSVVAVRVGRVAEVLFRLSLGHPLAGVLLGLLVDSTLAEPGLASELCKRGLLLAA